MLIIRRLRMQRPLWLALAVALPLVVAAATPDQLLAESLKTQTNTAAASLKAQERIAQLADQTADLLGDYRLTIQQLDRVRIYNNHLQKLVNDQEAEKADIQRQLDDFTDTEQGILPLMNEMIEDLGAFIELDTPFSLDERRARIQRLRDNMDKSDITISEKYRQIMEAYTIETTFGRDVEAYTGKLVIGGQTREVDFLRVGRILLAYQTKDRAETGFWNKTKGDWEELDDSFRKPITEGLRVARKQSAPNLLMLPIPGAEAAQ